MNVPQLVVDLNNKAIQNLLQGNCDGSVAALTSALSSLQVCHDFQSTANANAPLNLQLSMAAKLLEGRTSGDAPIGSVVLDHGSLSDCSGSFSIFNHTLTVPNVNGLDSNIGNNYERLQAMLLYNLGLTLHFQAMRSGRSDELQGALDLYEMAFSIVENSWQRLDVDDLMLLLMGILNNLGHIHSNLYNMERTQTCVDWLKALAGHPAFLKIMQRDQYAGFSMNLLVVLKQTPHCSPAA